MRKTNEPKILLKRLVAVLGICAVGTVAELLFHTLWAGAVVLFVGYWCVLAKINS